MSEHTYRDYRGPEGLRTRGTVLVVPGRGETQATYRRFGARLAADSYRVRVLDAPTIDDGEDVDRALDRFAGQLVDALADLEADDTDPLVRPLVLAGSDSGALAIAALVARAERSAPWWPQGAVLAGLPGYGPHDAGEWTDELDARSHCAVHRGVLSDDTAVQRGALNAALPNALLDLAYNSSVDLPQLLLVGDADPFADREALTRSAKSLPIARVTEVRGGHHDVLNDLQHRSVAAEVVTFLEALRNDPSLAPILALESTAW
jgi:alpha-beta hydrolase superfamily lysophospholipase